MLSDITIGQFFPGGSPLHRMDPRAKLVAAVALIVALFLASNPVALVFCAAFTFALILLSAVPVKLYFKSLKAILPVILLTAILNAVSVGSGRTLFSFWVVTVTTGGLQRAAEMGARILLLIMLSSALTFTTSPTQLTAGIESLLSPLQVFKLAGAVHAMAMMMTIALRFIPTLIEEADKIMSAQKARGADMDSGGLIHRVRAMIPILVPLLISAFRRAAELAEAMECRCYNGYRGRTRMRRLRIAPRDMAALALTALALTSVVLLGLLRGWPL